MTTITRTASTSPRQRWALGLASVGSFMVALDALVVATALSTIRQHLGASIGELEWTVNAYTLAFAVLLMTGAALGDRFGRRRMFVVGLGIFSLASAACALSPNIGWLIAARAIQGCGAALVMPLAMTLVSAAFPPEQRGRALGAFSGIAGLAVVAGPVLGGAITQGIAWQWIFWLNVPIGLVAIPFVVARIEESYGPNTPLDSGGLLLISGAVLGIVWGLVRSTSIGWGSFEVVAMLVVGIALAVAFVFWELRVQSPMLSMRFFASRAFTAANVACFFFSASLYGAVFFMAQFLQTAQGNSPLGAGLRLLPWTTVAFLSAPTAGRLINRFGERRIMIVALLLPAIAMAWIGLIARPDLGYAALVVPLLIAGLGPATFPTSQNVIVGAVAANAIGKASGAFNMLRQLGAAFGVAILAAAFAGAGSFHSPQTFANGFTPAMFAAAALSLLAAISAMVIPGKKVAQAAAGMAPTQVEIAPDPVETGAA